MWPPGEACYLVAREWSSMCLHVHTRAVLSSISPAPVAHGPLCASSCAAGLLIILFTSAINPVHFNAMHPAVPM